MSQTSDAQLPRLDAVQRRVLGVLIEKSLTTPAGYPMTLNALLAGCNQLTCRNPVMQLGESEVGKALHELQILPGGGLVRQAAGDRGARSIRFEHLAETRFGWDRRERAMMAELLLRGAQTAGELKTNASRMAGFEDLQTVMNLLETLARHQPPYLHELARQPGHSTVRFDHLFYPDGEEPIAMPAMPSRIANGSAEPHAARGSDLEARVAALEKEVADVRAQIQQFLLSRGGD